MERTITISGNQFNELEYLANVERFGEHTESEDKPMFLQVENRKEVSGDVYYDITVFYFGLVGEVYDLIQSYKSSLHEDCFKLVGLTFVLPKDGDVLYLSKGTLI